MQYNRCWNKRKWRHNKHTPVIKIQMFQHVKGMGRQGNRPPPSESIIVNTYDTMLKYLVISSTTSEQQLLQSKS